MVGVGIKAMEVANGEDLETMVLAKVIRALNGEVMGLMEWVEDMEETEDMAVTETEVKEVMVEWAVEEAAEWEWVGEK